MKITQMITHWEPDGALEVIEFVEQLREVLWLAYGQEIRQMHWDNPPGRTREDDRQLVLDLGDSMPF